MVGGVPPAEALRDLFYALGLGVLLSSGYISARMLLGSGKAACFFCDFSVLTAGALLYRSAALSRFYAGIPRWYTLAGCLLGYFGGCAALQPAMLAIARRVRRTAALPLCFAAEKLVFPAIGTVRTRFREKRAVSADRKNEKRKSKHKKRLQNGARVLYNSK